MVWRLLVRAVRKRRAKKSSTEQSPSLPSSHNSTPPRSPTPNPRHRIPSTESCTLTSNSSYSISPPQNPAIKSLTSDPTAIPMPETSTPQSSIPPSSRPVPPLHIKITPASPLTTPSPPCGPPVHAGQQQVAGSQTLRIGGEHYQCPDGVVYLAPPRTLYQTKRMQRLLRMNEAGGEKH